MWANELSTKHDSRTGKRDRLFDRNGSREVSFANTYPVGKASKQKIMSICGHVNRISQSGENRPSDGCYSTLTSRSYT